MFRELVEHPDDLEVWFMVKVNLTWWFLRIINSTL